MENKLNNFWNEILNHLQKKTFNEIILKEKIEPFFNYGLFKQNDDINQSLLTYSLIYKSVILFEFIVKRINFEDLEISLQKQISNDFFNIILHQFKNINSNLDYLLNILSILENSSFLEMVLIYTEKKNAENFLRCIIYFILIIFIY